MGAWHRAEPAATPSCARAARSARPQSLVAGPSGVIEHGLPGGTMRSVLPVAFAAGIPMSVRAPYQSLNKQTLYPHCKCIKNSVSWRSVILIASGAAIVLCVQALYRKLSRGKIHPYVKHGHHKSLAADLGALLESRHDTDLTLVAGGTELAAHRAILVARSPVFAAMMSHSTLESNSGRIIISDIEEKVLHQLLVYLYTDEAPQLPSMAAELLVAADKYDMAALKRQCEWQVAQDLSVENAATAAVIAVRHSCPHLKMSAVSFIKAHFMEVMGTHGWAEAVHHHPKDVVEISNLIAVPPIEGKYGNMSEEDLKWKLLQAARGCELDELRALLPAGANVGVRDRAKDTALHWAAAKGQVEAVKCLLQAGAIVNSQNVGQQTPLHWAAVCGQASVVQLLLEASADINKGDMFGDTPLHLAAEFGHVVALKMLLDKGAERNIKNKSGKMPQDVANHQWRQQVMNLLRGNSYVPLIIHMDTHM